MYSNYALFQGILAYMPDLYEKVKKQPQTLTVSQSVPSNCIPPTVTFAAGANVEGY